jgi:hypothetical protein
MMMMMMMMMMFVLKGFDKLCDHPYNDFLFAKVWLDTASAVPIACIPRSVTIHVSFGFFH